MMVLSVYNKPIQGRGGPALLTTESSSHVTGQGRPSHDAHHLFSNEHITDTCSMEGHLQSQAVCTPQCMTYA